MQDKKYFAQVELNHEVGTIQWSSGADFDPDVLYAVISDRPIPNYKLSRSA